MLRFHIKKGVLTYIRITLPAALSIVSALSLIYYVLLNRDTSIGAICYSLLPAVMGVVFATPFWVTALVHKYKN